MNELLVKDLLPDLEQATDVRQRIQEVRKKPAPSQISRDQSVFDAMNQAARMATAISTTTTSAVLSWNAISATSLPLQNPIHNLAMQDAFNQAQAERLRAASAIAGVFSGIGSWFSK